MTDSPTYTDEQIQRSLAWMAVMGKEFPRLVAALRAAQPVSGRHDRILAILNGETP